MILLSMTHLVAYDRVVERNIKLLIAYDGTDFHGWQTQTDLRTVQGEIEQAARRVARHQINLLGSGRTDAGVHAAGQVANFWTSCDIVADKLHRAIGSRLPKDVTLIDTAEVSSSFHSRASAESKLYRYRIHNASGRPVTRLAQRYCYHFWHPLDVDRMREAAAHFVGEMDFASMASKGSPRETTVRTVLSCAVDRHYDEVRIDVEGKGFLYNQVRNMVGTLVDIGRGHWSPDMLPEILASCDRSQAGPTAPARGLSLQWVRYPSHALRPPDADHDDEPAALTERRTI